MKLLHQRVTAEEAWSLGHGFGGRMGMGRVVKERVCVCPLLSVWEGIWNAQMMVDSVFLFLAIKYFYFWPPWLVGF